MSLKFTKTLLPAQKRLIVFTFFSQFQEIICFHVKCFHCLLCHCMNPPLENFLRKPLLSGRLCHYPDDVNSLFGDRSISKIYQYIVSPTHVSATRCVCRVNPQCNSNLLPHFCTGILSPCELSETGCASITISSHFWLNKLVSAQLILVSNCDEDAKTQKRRYFSPRNQAS